MSKSNSHSPAFVVKAALLREGTSRVRSRLFFTCQRALARPQSGSPMSDQEQAGLRLEFARLKQEHADFDAAIEAMIAQGCDTLTVQRMKKKKLAIKDRLQAVEDRIVPDIIA